MKALIIGLIALSANYAMAEGSAQICTPGQVWNHTSGDFVCAEDGRSWRNMNPAPNRCPEGKIVWMDVHSNYGLGPDGRAIIAQAQCVNGKYRFFNDAYNYRPTRGLNTCEEGKVWVEGQDRGFAGVTYVCENGRAVRIN